MYNAESVESKIRDYWSSKNINKKINASKKDKNNFIIFNPPALIKNDLDLRTIYQKTLYDIIGRYKHLQDYNIINRYGFNPFSLNIEKSLYDEEFFEGIKDIKDYEEFYKECNNRSKDFLKDYLRKYDDLGFSFDDGEIYKVDEKSFINSVWWTFNEFYKEDLIYNEERVLPWCRDCQSSITSLEYNIEKKEKVSYIIKFPVVKGKNRFILVNTEKPYTLLSNTTLMVDSESDYSVIKVDKDGKSEKYILLRKNLDEILDRVKIDDYKEINVVSGSKLNEFRYRHPLKDRIPYQKELDDEDYHHIIAVDEIEAKGTGIIPVCPGLEDDDYNLVQRLDLKKYSPINREGIVDDNSDYEGHSIEDTNTLIIDDLKENDLLFFSRDITDKSKVCKECDTEIFYRVDDEWYFKASSIIDEIRDNIEKTTLIPKGFNSNYRFNLKEKMKDWNISRRKGWGIPIPLWKCEDCEDTYIPESLESLSKQTEYNVNKILKNIENITIDCQECNEKMERENKVFNHLFLSACSAWTQRGYPTNNDFEDYIPFDILLEKIDEDQNLLNSYLSTSSAIFNKKTLEKFCKLGNINGDINFEKIESREGFDSLRLNLISTNTLEEDKEIHSYSNDKTHKLIRVLWNLHSFYISNKEKFDFEPEDVTKDSIKEFLDPEDEWIISRNQTVKKIVREEMDNYRFDKVVSTIEKFVIEDLAQWYIGLVRNRLSFEKDSLSILKILFDSLKNVSIMLAPITPYISEEIYQNVVGQKMSVNMERWPTVNRLQIDSKLEGDISIVKDIVDEIFKGKRLENLPLKWKLKRVVFDTKDDDIERILKKYSHIIKKIGRIKDLRIVQPEENWDEMELKVEPNKDAIGKSYRQWSSRIALLLKRRNPKEIKKGIETGEYTLGIEGHIVEIQPNMVNFSWKIPENFHEIELEETNIYLDLEITEDIWNNQITNEILLRLKMMRDEFDLEDDDEIEIYIKSSDDILEAIEKERAVIMKSVNGREIHFVEDDINKAEYVVEWEVNGEPVDIGVTPLYRTKILELYQSIPGMNENKAEALYNDGYTSIELLRNATPQEIATLPQISRILAKRIVQTIKERKKEEEKKERIEKEEKEKGVEEEVSKEKLLKDFQSIKGIGNTIAERIYDKGFQSYTDILEAEIEDFLDINMVTREIAKDIKELAKERTHKQY